MMLLGLQINYMSSKSHMIVLFTTLLINTYTGVALTVRGVGGRRRCQLEHLETQRSKISDPIVRTRP